jgi:uncharacterized membrane protein
MGLLADGCVEERYIHMDRDATWGTAGSSMKSSTPSKRTLQWLSGGGGGGGEGGGDGWPEVRNEQRGSS